MKSEKVCVRMTKDNKSIIDKAAENKNMNPSEYIRVVSIKAALMDTGGETSEPVKQLKGTDNRLYIRLTPELDKKITDMSVELGATKQECVRRLINEGKIYDLRMSIDMDEEFKEISSQIRDLNKKVRSMYLIVSKVEGVLTKREISNLFELFKYIGEKTDGILKSVWKTNSQLKIMAKKRLEKLIREQTKGGG